MLRPALILCTFICSASLVGCRGVPSLAADAGSDADAAQLPDIGIVPDAPLPDVGTAQIGESCRRGCIGGLSCETSWPAGGLCTKACKRDADCGSTHRCIDADGVPQPPPGATDGDGLCLPRCNVRAIVEPCRDGYVCRVAGQHGYCAPDCRQLPCDGGRICDSASGLCVDSSAGSIGQRCGKNIGTCDGTPNGVCLAIGTFFEPFCTIPCAPFTKPCPIALAGAACVLGGATNAYCAFTCNPDDPKCPSPDLACQKFSNDLAICTPKKQ